MNSLFFNCCYADGTEIILNLLVNNQTLYSWLSQAANLFYPSSSELLLEQSHKMRPLVVYRPSLNLNPSKTSFTQASIKTLSYPQSIRGLLWSMQVFSAHDPTVIQRSHKHTPFLQHSGSFRHKGIKKPGPIRAVIVLSRARKWAPW